jgi:hypothetical protein
LRLGVSATAADVDGDGLPDSWEEQIVAARGDDDIRTVEDVRTDDDFDGDGMPNVAEFEAGTNPTQASDRLALVISRTTETNVALRFSAAAGRRYRLESAVALGSNAGWTPVKDFAPGALSAEQLIEDQTIAPGGARFYRVRLLASP